MQEHSRNQILKSLPNFIAKFSKLLYDLQESAHDRIKKKYYTVPSLENVIKSIESPLVLNQKVQSGSKPVQNYYSTMEEMAQDFQAQFDTNRSISRIWSESNISTGNIFPRRVWGWVWVSSSSF